MAEPTLFDEASLALIASGGAGKDGKVYSVKPVPVYGPELVTNGDFATDSDWAKGSGVTISNGKALVTVINGGYQSLGQSLTYISGKSYTLTASVNGTVGKGCTFLDASGNNGGLNTSNGGVIFNGEEQSVKFKFTANSNSNTILLSRSGAGDYNFSIDNVSIQEILVSGDFTFSRGSNLSATRVNASQLIEKGRENLLTYSNDFSFVNWLATSSSFFTSGQVGYNGSGDAWLFTANAAGERIQRSISESGVYTLSAYFKKGTADGIRLRVDMSGSDANVYVNLIDGSLINSNGIIANKITDVGNGWYRVELTANWVSVINIRVYPTNTSGVNIAGTVLIQDFQLEQGLVSTPYIETGATTAQAGILENTPRFDYSGGATCPSLLLEPSRTNLLPQSEYFGAWDNFNGTTIELGYASPDGGNNAYKINGSLGGLTLLYNPSDVATDTRTIYARTISGSGELHLCSHSANTNNLFTITDQWQRFEVNGTTSSIGRTYFYAVDFRGSSTLTEVLIYAAQAEAAPYATSYIPTYGSSQTRSGDACNKTNASGVIGQTEGTLYSEVAFTEDGTQSQWLSISDGTSQNWIFVGKDANDIRGYVRASNSVIFSNQDFLIVDNSFVKIAIAYKSGDVALYINGTKISSSTGSFSFNNTLDRINFKTHDSGLTNEKARYKQVLVFKEALSDTELIKLTTI